MSVSAFDHVHIYAADPEVSIAFYQKGLGAESIGVLPGSGNPKHLLILGGQYLVLSAFPDGMQAKPAPDVGDGALESGFGVAHIGVNVNDLKSAISQLSGAGAVIHSDPRQSGPIRFVYATAPDGVIVELTQYDLPAKLAPALLFLRVFNSGIHLAKKTLAKVLVKSVS